MQGPKKSSLRWDADGLIPGVVQHAASGEIRMVGYLNRESLDLTIETRYVHFYSRSRQRLWKKGETSGNVLEVVEIRPDCDGDVLLIRAIPHGPTCHTGEDSCFFSEPLYRDDTVEIPMTSAVIEDVAAVIAARRAEMPAGSYTTYLFTEGVDKIGKKIGEEAAEVIIAAKNGDPGPLAMEAADLIYHLLVMLEACDVSPEAVWAELSARRGATPRSA